MLIYIYGGVGIVLCLEQFTGKISLNTMAAAGD